jgi:hypothetical protein
MKYKNKNNKSYKSFRSRLRRKSDHKIVNLFDSQVCHLLKWLIQTYGISADVWKPSLRYMWFIQHMCLSKGLKTTIQRIKQDRLQVLQYLSGETPSGPGLTHDGLPKKLNGLILYIRNKDIKIYPYSII